MLQKTAVLALSMVLLGGLFDAAQAQNAPRYWPFPDPGTFSGRVMSRGFRPYPIPLAANATAGAPAPTAANANIAIDPLPFGSPVAGATVEVRSQTPWIFDASAKGAPAGAKPGYWPAPQQVWTAITSGDGSFSIAGLPAASYTFRVTAPDYAPSNGNFTESFDRGIYEEILMRKSVNKVGSFSGRVTALPLIRAIPLAATTNAGAPAPETATDDQAAADPQETALDQQDAAYAAAHPTAQATASSPVAGAAPGALIMPLPPIFWGRPLAGAIVTVHAQPIFYAQPLAAGTAQPAAQPAGGANSLIAFPDGWTATTDENGHFAIDGLPAGSYTYSIGARWYRSRGGSFFVNDFNPSVVRNIQLERRVRGVFAGVVGEGPQLLIPVDPPLPLPIPYGAKPTANAADAKSLVLPFRFAPLSGARVLAIRTNFGFPPPPRPLPIGGPIPLAANGAAPTSATPASASGTDDASLLKLSDDPSAGATAAPADDGSDDKAAATAEASASASALTTPAPAGAPVASSSLVQPLPPTFVRPPYLRRAITDGSGHFRMDLLPPGSYRFIVRADNHAARFGSFTISTWSPRVYRRILLPQIGEITPNGVLNGTVYGYRNVIFPLAANGGTVTQAPPAGGAPIQPAPYFGLANATVSIASNGTPTNGLPIQLYQTTTDAQGNFSLNLPPGSYTATASCPGFSGGSQPIYFNGTGPNVLFYLTPTIVGIPPVQPVENPGVSGTSVEDPFNSKK